MNAHTDDYKKLVKLANALVTHDEIKNCPFCSKDTWGEEMHDNECPFAIAYTVIHDEENHE